MPSSFTSRLKLERQASGENSGTWGNLVNYVLNRVDASVSGFQAVNVAGSANVTLTSNNSTSNTDDSTTDDQVHNATLEFTGALGAAIHVFTDAVEQNYTVFNNTTGSYNLTFANTGHAANGVVLKQGAKTLVYTDGSSVTDVMADLGDVTVTYQKGPDNLNDRGDFEDNGNNQDVASTSRGTNSKVDIPKFLRLLTKFNSISLFLSELVKPSDIINSVFSFINHRFIIFKSFVKSFFFVSINF